MVGQRASGGIVLVTMLLLGGCERPSSDRAKLDAIKAEAFSLMTLYPVETTQSRREIPKDEWPSSIASLRPESVTVHWWGVDITTRPYFDGGWGYEIPRHGQELPMPAECYSEPSQGVFWHGPC